MRGDARTQGRMPERLRIAERVTGGECRLPRPHRAFRRTGAGLAHLHADDGRGARRQSRLPPVRRGDHIHDEEGGRVRAAADFQHGRLVPETGRLCHAPTRCSPRIGRVPAAACGLASRPGPRRQAWPGYCAALQGVGLAGSAGGTGVPGRGFACTGVGRTMLTHTSCRGTAIFPAGPAKAKANPADRMIAAPTPPMVETQSRLG
jgi:hypothetical protein